MRNILIVAGKEIQEGLRNRWVLAATLLLAALALTLTFLGSAPTGSVGVRSLDVVIVSLSSLTIFILPLIALLISHDTIIGDMERGTMILLLSYPVARWQVVIGKFCGHLAILAFATSLGYGAAALALTATGVAIDCSARFSSRSAISSARWRATAARRRASPSASGSSSCSSTTWRCSACSWSIRGGSSRPAFSMCCSCSTPTTYIACSISPARPT